VSSAYHNGTQMEHNQGTLMSRLYKFTLCNLFQKAVTKLEKNKYILLETVNCKTPTLKVTNNHWWIRFYICGQQKRIREVIAKKVLQLRSIALLSRSVFLTTLRYFFTDYCYCNTFISIGDKPAFSLSRFLFFVEVAWKNCQQSSPTVYTSNNGYCSIG